MKLGASRSYGSTAKKSSGFSNPFSNPFKGMFSGWGNKASEPK